jgi:hypothetical protein
MARRIRTLAKRLKRARAPSVCALSPAAVHVASKQVAATSEKNVAPVLLAGEEEKKKKKKEEVVVMVDMVVMDGRREGTPACDFRERSVCE